MGECYGRSVEAGAGAVAQHDSHDDNDSRNLRGSWRCNEFACGGKGAVMVADVTLM